MPPTSPQYPPKLAPGSLSLLQINTKSCSLASPGVTLPGKGEAKRGILMGQKVRRWQGWPPGPCAASGSSDTSAVVAAVANARAWLPPTALRLFWQPPAEGRETQEILCSIGNQGIWVKCWFWHSEFQHKTGRVLQPFCNGSHVASAFHVPLSETLNFEFITCFLKAPFLIT